MNCKPAFAIVWIATLTFFLLPTTVSASSVYAISGEITASSVTGSTPDDLVQAGDTINGELIYNPDVLSDGYLDDGGYVSDAPILYASLSNGRASWGSAFGIDNLSEGSGFAGRNVFSGILEDNGVKVASHDDRQAILAIPGLAEWTPPADYPANDFALPSVLNLSSFSGGEFEWEFSFPDFYADSGDKLFIEGSIDQIKRVSEPGSLVLLVIGLIAIARRFGRAA